MYSFNTNFLPIGYVKYLQYETINFYQTQHTTKETWYILYLIWSLLQNIITDIAQQKQDQSKA